MSDDKELKQATQDILHAEKSLRELAERVKAYPEAAQRLNEVCNALERTAASLHTAAGLLKKHEELMEQANQRLGRLEQTMTGILKKHGESMEQANQRLGRLENSIETLSTTLMQQSPLLEKAAGKRGIVF